MTAGLHRIVCDWGNGYRLELEAAEGQSGAGVALTYHAFLVEAESELRPDAFSLAGVPAIALRLERDALFEPLQLREETDYLLDITVPHARATAAAKRASSSSWPLSPRLEGIFRSDPPKRWRDVAGGIVVTGSMNFGSRVGIASLSPEHMQTVRFEIVPRKLGYFSDFKALLEDIANEVTALLVEVEGVSSIALHGDEHSTADPTTRLFHYRALMGPRSLPAAIDAIVARPHTRLINEIVFDRPDIASDTDTEPYASHVRPDDLITGGLLARMVNGYSPTTLPRHRSGISFDTPENRYAKAVLQEFADDVERLEQQLSRADKQRSAAQALAWGSQIDNWLGHPMWRDVRPLRALPSNSQVLHRREGYRDILAADLRLQLGMKLPWSRGVELSGGFDGDLRPIEELYEYWCYFTLRSILRDICGTSGVQKGSLLRRSANGFEVRLRKGHKTRTDFTYLQNGRTIRLALVYNRSFIRRESRHRAGPEAIRRRFDPTIAFL